MVSEKEAKKAARRESAQRMREHQESVYADKRLQEQTQKANREAREELDADRRKHGEDVTGKPKENKS